MTAIEVIMAHLLHAGREGEPQIRQEAQGLYQLVAHDLAEAIRSAASAEIDAHGERTSPGDRKYDIAAGMVKGADLIDPQVP